MAHVQSDHCLICCIAVGAHRQRDRGGRFGPRYSTTPAPPGLARFGSSLVLDLNRGRVVAVTKFGEAFSRQFADLSRLHQRASQVIILQNPRKKLFHDLAKVCFNTTALADRIDHQPAQLLLRVFIVHEMTLPSRISPLSSDHILVAVSRHRLGPFGPGGAALANVECRLELARANIARDSDRNMRYLYSAYLFW
jgi:hypothetical protein